MVPEEHLEFLNAVWSRRKTFTYVFLAANIAIFVLMAFAGGTTNETTLMAFGVKSNAEIDQGQIWRFVTPVFIHIGLLHLFFNSYALWIVGPQVEKLYGSAAFVILYLLTGIAGVAGSYFYHPYTISAGASGAIFGLFGVLLVFGVRYRHSIPPSFKRAVGTGVLPVIAINLVIGLMIPQIDNSAHVSGLIAGAVLAGIVPFQRPGSGTHSFLGAAQIALLALVAVSFYEVGVHYNGPRLSVRNMARGFTQLGSSGSSVQDFIDALNNAQKAFESSARELEDGNTAGLEEVQAEMTKAIDQLRNIPSLAARADELTADMLTAMQDQYDLVRDVQSTGRVTLSHDQKLKQNVDHYEKAMKSISDWVDTDGQKYGIQMGKPR